MGEIEMRVCNRCGVEMRAQRYSIVSGAELPRVCARRNGEISDENRFGRYAEENT